MKKIIQLLCFLCLVMSMWSQQISYADCEYNEGSSIGQNLDSCLSDSNLVNPGDGLIEWGVKNQIVTWTTNLAQLLGLLAVWAIVYGAGMMTLSAGDDEKIKKWKDVIKWAMLWFLWLLLAGWLVRIVIEIMFSLAG